MTSNGIGRQSSAIMGRAKRADDGGMAFHVLNRANARAPEIGVRSQKRFLTPVPSSDADAIPHNPQWEVVPVFVSPVGTNENAPCNSLFINGLRRGKFLRRRGGDSNPRSPFGDTAFPVLHNRPLCHLSETCLSANRLLTCRSTHSVSRCWLNCQRSWRN